MAWGRCKKSSLQIRHRIDNGRNKVKTMQFSRLGAASLNLICTSILMHIMNTSISPDHLDKWWIACIQKVQTDEQSVRYTFRARNYKYIADISN